jgi:hypothetical protein
MSTALDTLPVRPSSILLSSDLSSLTGVTRDYAASRDPRLRRFRATVAPT